MSQYAKKKADDVGQTHLIVFTTTVGMFSFSLVVVVVIEGIFFRDRGSHGRHYFKLTFRWQRGGTSSKAKRVKLVERRQRNWGYEEKKRSPNPRPLNMSGIMLDWLFSRYFKLPEEATLQSQESICRLYQKGNKIWIGSTNFYPV